MGTLAEDTISNGREIITHLAQAIDIRRLRGLAMRAVHILFEVGLTPWHTPSSHLTAIRINGSRAFASDDNIRLALCMDHRRAAVELGSLPSGKYHREIGIRIGSKKKRSTVAQMQTDVTLQLQRTIHLVHTFWYDDYATASFTALINERLQRLTRVVFAKQMGGPRGTNLCNCRSYDQKRQE